MSAAEPGNCKPERFQKKPTHKRKRDPSDAPRFCFDIYHRGLQIASRMRLWDTCVASRLSASVEIDRCTSLLPVLREQAHFRSMMSTYHPSSDTYDMDEFVARQQVVKTERSLQSSTEQVRTADQTLATLADGLCDDWSDVLTSALDGCLPSDILNVVVLYLCVPAIDLNFPRSADRTSLS